MNSGNLSSHIFLILFFCLALGIGIAQIYPYFNPYFFYTYLFFSISIGVYKKWGKKNYFSLFILLNTIFLGYSIVVIGEEYKKNNGYLLPEELDNIEYYKAEIVADSIPKKKLLQTYLSIEKVRDSLGNWYEKRGKIYALLQRSKKDSFFEVGKKIIVYGKPEKLALPKNPFQFDYANHLQLRGVDAKDFILSNRYVYSDEEVVVSLWQQFRNYYVSLLREHLPKETFSIALSILLGNTSLLDEETEDIFRDTGSMHLLAVSGIHIGIFSFLLRFLFIKYFFPKKYQWVGDMMILAGVWIYAGMAYFTASVLRSVGFISFYFLSSLFNRRNVSFLHILSMTAFFMALYQPHSIFTIGFQLSFLAVLSIYVFYPLFFSFWIPKKWIIKKIWEGVCLSFSAQILIFPLLIYYFHQFPLFFWLSNIVSVALVTCIIGLGILLFLFSKITFLVYIIATLFILSIKVLMFFLTMIKKIPYGVVEEIYLQEWEFILILTFLLVLLFLLRKKTYQLLLYSTLFLIFFYTCRIANLFLHEKQNYFTLFYDKKVMMGFVDGLHLTILADSMLLKNRKNMDFILKPYTHHLKIKQVDCHSIEKAKKMETPFIAVYPLSFGALIFHKKKKYLYVSKKIEKIKADSIEVLIVAKNSIRNISSIEGIQYEKCIITPSNTEKLRKEIGKQIMRKDVILRDKFIFIDSQALHIKNE